MEEGGAAATARRTLLHRRRSFRRWRCTPSTMLTEAVTNACTPLGQFVGVRTPRQIVAETYPPSVL
eukprot:3982295-Amphidinium_carterae.1